MWRGSSFSVVTHLFWVDSHAVSWLWWALWKTYECQQPYTDTFGLPGGAHCSFISELERGSRHFTYQKVQDKNATQQESQLTWWSHTVQVLKTNVANTNSYPTLLFPSSLRADSIFLTLFCLFPPLCAGNCCPLRVTVADLEDSLDY